MQNFLRSLRHSRRYLIPILGILLIAACQAASPVVETQMTASPQVPTETPIFGSGATPIPYLLTQAAHTPTIASQPQTPVQTQNIASQQPETSPTPTIASQDNGSLLPTAMPSPTPDLRLLPEDWQEWPVTPERISASMRQVYLQGLANGNNPHAFSKVGDCQNVTGAFLGFFDQPGTYQLVGKYEELQATIDYFSGSFGRDSQAVRGGFNVASVLSPIWADLEACQQGETPLECEFRLHRPSIVLISMETWFPGREVDTYTKYLRQIIEFSIQHGAVPILATKADNTEGDHSINLAIARLAYEYDLPLWNFWKAVQPLPNNGIDWDRDATGFHVTIDAWNVRSFTALDTINAVWHLLTAPANEPVAAPLYPAHAPTATQLATSATAELPYLQTGAANTGASDRIWLSLGERSNEQEQSSGLLQLDPTQNSLQTLTSTGYSLERVSPDGRYVLLSQGETLFLLSTDNTLRQLISNSFFAISQNGVTWLSEPGAFAYIERDPQAPSSLNLMVRHVGEDHALAINQPKDTPIQLYSSSTGTRLYWENGDCSAGLSACTSSGLRWSDWFGQEQGAAPEIIRPETTTDGRLAYTHKNTDGSNSLLVEVPGEGKPRNLRTTNNMLESYQWSPDGMYLLLIEAEQSGYSNRVLDRRYWLFKAPSYASLELDVDEDGRATYAAWAPDSAQILFLGLISDEQAAKLHYWLVKSASRSVTTEADISLAWGGAFVYIQTLTWLP